MGLDIVACDSMTLCEDEEGYHIWENDDFPGRFPNCVEGWYDLHNTISFSAGSYIGYNIWRRKLARMAGYKPDPDNPQYGEAGGAWILSNGPFWELINFTDCDGSIGPSVSEKLAKDFANHDPKKFTDDEKFIELYELWQKAFELAAKGGCVRFG